MTFSPYGRALSFRRKDQLIASRRTCTASGEPRDESGEGAGRGGGRKGERAQSSLGGRGAGRGNLDARRRVHRSLIMFPLRTCYARVHTDGQNGSALNLHGYTWNRKRRESLPPACVHIIARYAAWHFCAVEIFARLLPAHARARVSCLRRR